jgi:hypothetical protein
MRMCFGGFHPAKNVEVPPTPVGGAPPVDGLFMYSEEPLRLNETFHMQINTPNHKATDFTGRVIWSDLYAFGDQNTVYGTGICFVKISERDRHLLNEILSTHTPDTQ